MTAPSWCPPPLVQAALARSSSNLEMVPHLPDHIDREVRPLCSSHTIHEGIRLLMVNLHPRLQAVALLVREPEENLRIVEALSFAGQNPSDAQVVNALATNGRPGGAGLVTIEVEGTCYLFARATNLLESLDDVELVRTVRHCAHLADAWEARHTGGEDQW